MSSRIRTQIGIIGAGPAGMLLAHLLKRHGIESVVLEHHSRDYVEGRVRAGVLEHGTVELLKRLGVGERLQREGLVHRGTNLCVDGVITRIDMAELTNGATVTVYGQQEVLKDLFDAAPAQNIEVQFGVSDVELQDIEEGPPIIRYRHMEEQKQVDCDFVAGCDGSHGISRKYVPDSGRQVFERSYPFGWLGILADVPPAHHELIYCNHARGFALASMRSPTRSRYYLQCSLGEQVDDWPDERFWDELCARLGPAASTVTRGPSFEKSIAPLRSFVHEPMRHRHLFLAGDAAHIVPPAGAKGLNLAASDVRMLSEAFAAYYRAGSLTLLDSYSSCALARVWIAERFSWWFTWLTHRFPDMDGFDRNIQLAELAYIRRSQAAQTSFAENYVGLPVG